MGRSRTQHSLTFQEMVQIMGDLPVLGNIKRPLEQQVRVFIVIDELGDGIVVTTGNHARGSLLLRD